MKDSTDVPVHDDVVETEEFLGDGEDPKLLADTASRIYAQLASAEPDRDTPAHTKRASEAIRLARIFMAAWREDAERVS